MWTAESWYMESRKWAEANQEFVRKLAALHAKTLKHALPGVPAEEIFRMVKDLNRQRLDAVPSYVKYPELRGMRSLLEAEWRGLKDGAGLSDEYLAVYCGGLYFYHHYIACGKIRPLWTIGADESANAGRCSWIFFPDSDHGPLIANNLDSTPEEPFGPPEWPMLNEHVIAGGVSSGVYLDETPPEIFPAPVMKIAARYCRNTKETVELLERYNYFWGPCNLLVVDRQKNVAMIEKTSCRIGVRWSPDGFGFITAMTAEHPDIHAYLEDRRIASIKARNLPANNCDMIYWKKQDERRALMNQLLDEARRNPTLETMRAFIQFRDPERGNVCGNGDVYAPGCPKSEYTIRTSIWLLHEGRAMWWAKEDERPSYENRKPDVTFTNALLWD